MIPIGFALAWFGYATAFYGHALIKGYNISFAQVVSPVNFYKGKWPPPLATNTVIFPNGKAADNGGGTGATTGGSGSVASMQKRVDRAARAAGRTNPDSVASRY